MDCAKQQDSSGRSLWTQLRKNLLDSRLVQQIHACYSKKTIFGICIIIMYVDHMLTIGMREQIQDFATKRIFSKNTA